MQGRTLNEAVRSTGLDAGKYPARLKAVTIWTSESPKSGVEPMVKFHWEIPTEDGETIGFTDSFVNIRRDNEGYPIFTGTASDKFYDRVSALYGERFDPKTTPFSFQTESANWTINNPDDLLTFPNWQEGKEEGFKPIYLKEIIVNGRDVINADVEVELELVKETNKQGKTYTNCKSVGFKARLPSRRQAPPSRPAPRPALETIDLPA